MYPRCICIQVFISQKWGLGGASGRVRTAGLGQRRAGRGGGGTIHTYRVTEMERHLSFGTHGSDVTGHVLLTLDVDVQHLLKDAAPPRYKGLGPVTGDLAPFAKHFELVHFQLQQVGGRSPHAVAPPVATFTDTRRRLRAVPSADRGR